jgi:hypothetical protein
MAEKLKDQLSKKYVTLDCQMSLREARRALNSASGALGVIFDGDLPVTLVRAEDLAKPVTSDEDQLAILLPGLPPGITASSEMTVEAFLDSNAFSATDLGARGALVMDGTELAGAFTQKSIDDALRKQGALLLGVRGFSPGDSQLAGEINTPKVVIYCDRYHHRNELDYYNRIKPPLCQVPLPEPHPLKGS